MPIQCTRNLIMRVYWTTLYAQGWRERNTRTREYCEQREMHPNLLHHSDKSVHFWC